MALDITKLAASVANTKTVEASAIAAFDGISVQLKDISSKLAEAQKNNDPAATAAAQTQLDGLTSDLDAQASALAASVAKNTVADPAAVANTPLA